MPFMFMALGGTAPEPKEEEGGAGVRAWSWECAAKGLERKLIVRLVRTFEGGGLLRDSSSERERVERYAGRSIGDVRESSSREERVRSRIEESVGRGAILMNGCS